jgi:hypothetical protein
MTNKEIDQILTAIRFIETKLVDAKNAQDPHYDLFVSILEYLEGREDVNFEGDGPNKAMQIANEIRQIIGE